MALLYNDFNRSENLYFSTDLKANWWSRRNCGGSNDLNRIESEPRKRVASDDFSSYWLRDTIELAKRIGIKATTILTCPKILI